MIRRHGFWFRTLLVTADALVALGLLVAVSVWRIGPGWAEWWRGAVSEPIAFFALYVAGWVTILAAVGLYRPRARWSLRSEAADITRATGVLALLTLSVLFLLHLPDVSRLLLLILFPAQAVATIVTRAAIRGGLEHLRRQGRNQRFVVVLGAGPRGRAFANTLEDHRELGLKVIGFLDSDPEYQAMGSRPILGKLDDLEHILHTRIVDEVAMCLPFSQWDRIDAIATLCQEEGKIVRIPMDVTAQALSMGRVEVLDGTPVFSLVSGPDRALALAAKQIVDLVGATSLLVLLSPILAAVAIAIRVIDGSPVVFRQTRVGLHGRPFEVVKFRTMTPDAEDRYAEVVNLSDPRAFKLSDDPRITPLGRFLRRTSLDELPQLWNVLRGQMSLVGPRPAPPREVEGYDLWHRRRLSMKPGITGLWQVTARRDEDFDNRASLDLDYIDRWSIWLDMKILLRTIPAALEGR